VSQTLTKLASSRTKVNAMPIKILPIKNNILHLSEYIRFQLKGHSDAWNIFTHLTSQERMMLYYFARHLEAESIICEIGSYLGASASFLAAGASEVIGKPVAVHCIDTWDNKGMTEGPRNTWNEFKKISGAMKI
jgi:predicted O-methyltransferase YrrM